MSKGEVLKSNRGHDRDEELVFEEIDEEPGKKVKFEEPDEESLEPPLTKMKFAYLVAQRVIFFLTWCIFTTFLLGTKTDKFEKNFIGVPAANSYDYALNKYDGSNRLGVLLEGPFMHDSVPKKQPTPQLTVMVVRKLDDGEIKELSKNWKLKLGNDVDNGEIVREEHVFEFDNSGKKDNKGLALRFSTNLETALTVKSQIDFTPLNKKNGVIVGALVLVFLYILIVFEVINRTFAAMLASTLAIATLAALDMHPTVATLVSWIDVETILLLFAMMILVGILAESGLFDYMTVFAYKITKGRIWPLINTLCFFTALCSTFMDSVTMMLLVTPVTIRLCEITELNPVPILMCMVFYSNVGAAITPVGDPPNVIITTNHYIASQGMNFLTFMIHMLPGVILAIIQTYFQLRFIYRDINDLKFEKPLPEAELIHEIQAWKRAADTIEVVSKDENIVHDTLIKKANKLKKLLSKGSTPPAAQTPHNYEDVLMELRATYYIRDVVLLIKSLIAFALAAFLFCVHSVPTFHNVSLGWAALISALLLLVISDIKHLPALLRRVEWSTLLFFASLFVLMETLAKMGVIEVIGDWVKLLILLVPPKDRLICAILVILWVSAIASAFLDNIPVATMMVKIVIQLAQNPDLKLPLHPLCWALALGACFGGNGTLIGASANVVAAGVAEQHGHKFTFIGFFLVGFPIMLGNTVMASIYLLISHMLFHWH